MKKRSTSALNMGKYFMSNHHKVVMRSFWRHKSLGVLSYINLIDIALKQCQDQESQTVHPHHDFPHIPPPPPLEKKMELIL